MTWVIDELLKGHAIKIVTDQWGNPTFAEDLASALLTFYKQNKTGIYNTVGNEWLSRYEFAVKIAKVFQLDETLIKKATTDRLKQSAPRPKRGGLYIDKMMQETGFVFSSVEDSLQIMKEQMENSKVMLNLL